jgi:hypothetical protein
MTRYSTLLCEWSPRSGYQHVELAKSVSDGSAVKARDDLARIRVDVVDITNIAVVDLLIVVVLDLHDLVAGGGPAEPSAIAGRIERGLQFDVQRTCPRAAAVHGHST